MTTFITKPNLFGRLVIDGLVISSTCSCLHIFQKLLFARLQQLCPNLSETYLQILSTEAALIPTRVLMTILNIPCLAQAVSNETTWLPVYSELAALSW
jgi:hypothetical protein